MTDSTNNCKHWKNSNQSRKKEKARSKSSQKPDQLAH